MIMNLIFSKSPMGDAHAVYKDALDLARSVSGVKEVHPEIRERNYSVLERIRAQLTFAPSSHGRVTQVYVEGNFDAQAVCSLFTSRGYSINHMKVDRCDLIDNGITNKPQGVSK